MDYFTDFTSTLPDVQRNHLNNYIERRKLERTIKSIDVDKWRGAISDANGAPIPISRDKMVRATFGGSMGAVAYDDLVDSLLLDLGAMFDYSMIIDNDIANNEIEFKNFIKKADVSISAIEDRLTEYKSILGDIKGYNAAYTQGFTEVTGAKFIRCNASAGNLCIESRDIQPYNYDVNIDKVMVDRYPAPLLSSSYNIRYASPPQNSITKDYNSAGGTRSMLRGGTVEPGFYLEVMLVSGSETKPTVYIDGETYRGLVIVVYIYFSGAYNINELVIDPISKHMVNVRRLRYSVDTDNNIWLPVAYVDDEGNTRNASAEDYGKMTMRFSPIVARGLEVTLNVVDSDAVRFMLDNNIILNETVWEEVIDGEYAYLTEKLSNKGTISASAATGDNRTYDKMIVAVTNSNVVENAQVQEVTKEIIGVDNNESSLGVAARNRVMAENITLNSVTMNEYVLGLYSMCPRSASYYQEATFYSHVDGGYDTKRSTVRNVMIESDHTTPAATTVEYFLVTDDGTELPILPIGTALYREPVIGEVDGGGNIDAVLTYTPSSTVTMHYWDQASNSLVQVGAAVPATNKQVTFSGASPLLKYVMVYTVSVTANPYEVSLPSGLTMGWAHTELNPQGYKALLPTTPYIEYGYYNWSSALGANSWNYTRELAGYYSDRSVLTQDLSDGMWEIIPSRSGVQDAASLSFYSANRTQYVISGQFTMNNGGFFGDPHEYRVKFTGTGREQNEYTYVWYAVVSGFIPGEVASGLVLNNSNMYIPGDTLTQSEQVSRALTPAQKAEYSTAIYDPIAFYVDGKKAADKTSYLKDTQELLDAYTTSNDYRYYYDNSALYTNMNFDILDRRRLSARFRYLTSFVRLKIVLKTNTVEYSKYTPQVNSYTIKFLGG